MMELTGTFVNFLDFSGFFRLTQQKKQASNQEIKPETQRGNSGKK